MPPKRKASKLPTSKDSDSSKKAKSSWTAEEDEALLKAVQEDRDNHEEEEEEEEDWDEIANAVPGKSAVQCLKRHMVLVEKEKEKASPKKKKVASSPRPSAEDAGSGEDGNWTGNEIELLRKLVEQYEDGKWTESLNM